MQLLAIGLVVYVLALVWHTMRRLRRPPRRTYVSAVARGKPGDPSEALNGRAYETWAMRSDGLDLPVWDVAGDDPDGPVVIMVHGWGDARVGALARLPAIVPAASRVVMLELPGHGEAPGKCSLGAREVEDLCGLVERVREGDRKLVVFGWSLGAGVAIAAGAGTCSEQIDGIVAEAPYRLAPTPARNVLRNANLPHSVNLGPAMAVLGMRFGVGPQWRGFDRAELASKLACPLLVVHGAHDEVCPIEDGREIASRAPEGELCEIEGGRHNNLWTDEEPAETAGLAVRGFLGRVGAGGEST